MAAEAAAAPCTKLGRMGVGAHPRGAWRGDSSRAARRVRRPCRPSPLRMFIVERACVFGGQQRDRLDGWVCIIVPVATRSMQWMIMRCTRAE